MACGGILVQKKIVKQQTINKHQNLGSTPYVYKRQVHEYLFSSPYINWSEPTSFK